MRCTWRGPSNGSQLQLGEDALDEDTLVRPDEAQARVRVQYVMNAAGGAGGELAQHVYNLVLEKS